MRRRAQSASNFMGGAPMNEIQTDVSGVVLHVTEELCKFTGYSRSEMIGRKCNFLQGEGTDKDDVMELRQAMEAQRQTSVVILNYCKDGTPFWNILTIIPQFSPGTTELTRYTSEVINLTVPPQMRSRPRLCLDDAMALISVFSSVPRALEFGNKEYIGYNIDKSAIQDLDVMGQEEQLEDLQETSGNDSIGCECCSGTGVHSGIPSSPRSNDSKTRQVHQNYAKKFAGGKQNKPATTSRYSFIAETALPTRQGRFRVRAYRDDVTGAEPLAMIVGKVEGKEDVVVRVHDQCLTSEVFGSLKCDCKEQLDYALEYIQSTNLGIVLYLPQEGRGIGLANKVAAYAAQETGLDTVDANRHLGLPDDAREYDSVRDILADLGVKSIKLLSNNPRKFSCLQDLGVVVSERLPCVIVPNSEYSMKYVHSKAQRMGHMINVTSVSNEFNERPKSPAQSPRIPPIPQADNIS